jgi:hypothetical protein
LISRDVINPVASECSHYGQLFSTYWGQSTLGQSLGPGYIGLEFALDGASPHHAWVGATVLDGLIRIGGYAYEATPGAPIVAGDTGSAPPAYPLDAALSQTVFPPEGGPVTLTVTVTNPTAEAATLDLWAVIRRNAGVNGPVVRHLGTGTVAAGATETRALALEVPAWAPGGTYEVKVHVGRSFPGVADTEVFAITKEGALGAAGESTANLFAGEPLEGDLFAGSTVVPSSSVAVPPRTHALSAPRPNPSSGRTELTIEVADAQHVRVEVLDALGRRVATLHDGVLAAGITHRLAFDGSSLPAGVYAVRAVGERFADVRTATLAH